MTNPPYGERIGEVRDLVPTYREFGDRLRSLCGGYEVAIFSGNEELTKQLYLEKMRHLPLKNGAIDCEIIQGILPEAT